MVQKDRQAASLDNLLQLCYHPRNLYLAEIYILDAQAESLA